MNHPNPSPTTRHPPLHHIQIVELAQTPAAAYAGRLLMGLGATIISVEPPQGSPLRRRGPFPNHQPHHNTGALHLHLQRGKHSRRLNLRTAAAQRLLHDLLTQSHILTTDLPIDDWPQLNLTPNTLRQRHPQLHICTITPYGAHGPKAHWQTTELTAYAAGGYLRITGDPQREPVKAWGDQAHYQAGLHAALGILAALHAQTTQTTPTHTPNGQHIDVAIFEAVAFLLGGGYQHAWFRHHEPTRNGARLVGFGPAHLYPSTIRPCADGYIHAHCNNRYPEHMAILFQQPRLAQPDLLQTLMAHADEIDNLMAPTLQTTTRRQIVQRAQQLRIPFTEVLSPSEVLADHDNHHTSRHFWHHIPHPDPDNPHNPLSAPGPAIRLTNTPWQDHQAPNLDQHPHPPTTNPAQLRRANIT